MNNRLLIVSLLTFALSGCSDRQYVPPPVYQQPVVAPVVMAATVAPIIIQQAPAAHSDGLMTGALMGGALGYMAGRSGSSNNQPSVNHTTINKTVIVKQYAAPVPPPVVKAAPVMQRSVYVAPTAPQKLSLNKTAPQPTGVGGFARRH